MTMLIDHTRGKSVQLNHFAKTAQTEDIPDRPGESGFPDLVAGFRHLRNAEGITAAGEELLGTVKAKRYTLKTAEFLGGKGPCDVSVWIDPKSGLPVKVRLEFDVPKKVDGKLVPTGDKSLIVFEDFQFDVKLKDDTFSMDVPKGYQTKAKESAPAVEFISHTVNLEQAMENAATAKTDKIRCDGSETRCESGSHIPAHANVLLGNSDTHRNVESGWKANARRQSRSRPDGHRVRSE